MDYLAIIERIEARLKEIKMGKMEFYKALGISANSFWLWKNEKAKPTNENLEKASSILGCDLEYLMFGKKEKAHPRNEDELDKILVDMLKALTPSEVALTVAYVQGLIANRKA